MPRISQARILIVDDNPSNVLLIERILQSGGFNDLHSINDPSLVLPVVNEYQPDLILLDLHMPVVDGFEVIRQLREVHDAEDFLPILILTADVNPAARNKALAMGAKDFICKPFDGIEVLLRVRNLLETRFLYEKLADDLDE